MPREYSLSKLLDPGPSWTIRQDGTHTCNFSVSGPGVGEHTVGGKERGGGVESAAFVLRHSFCGWGIKMRAGYKKGAADPHIDWIK